jgi:transcriptional regulator with XRE-family HTH domain/tetratricopeptide (TPR) repeat protein
MAMTARRFTYWLEQQVLQRGLKWHELADRAGITAGYCSQIRRGTRLPSAKVLADLAKALQVPIADVFAAAGLDPGLVRTARARGARLRLPQGKPTGGAYVALTASAQRSLLPVAAEQPEPNRVTIDQVWSALATSFSGGAVVVHSRLAGLPDDAASSYFLVEHCPEEVGLAAGARSGGPTTHLVRVVGPSSERAATSELDAWRAAVPEPSADGADIMASLDVVQAGSGSSLRSIVYDIPSAALGGLQIVPLEHAIERCCRWGTPSVESIERALTRLFYGLGAALYSHAQAVQAGRGDDPGRLLARLRELVSHWQDSPSAAGHDAERLRCRREALGFLSRDRDTFLEPSDYIHWALGGPDQDPGTARLPRMLLGFAHGNLHGRNIVVSIDRDEVHSGVVFDYRAIRAENWVAADFAGLETHLKMALLPDLLAGSELDFLEVVSGFERALAESTERQHRAGPGDSPDTVRPREWADERLWRLARLVLQIRQQARLHTGVKRGRPREWLEEYYFLLAQSGLEWGLRPWCNRRQLMAAYTSAGVAARRLSLPWTVLSRDIVRAESAATAAMAKAAGEAGEAADGDGLGSAMSFAVPLACARKWARSRDEPWVQHAVQVLEQLRQQFPHVLEIDEEMTLACLELQDTRGAEEILRRVGLRYRLLHPEVLCRRGRAWMTRAERLLEGGKLGEARLCLEQALDEYRRAYDLHGDHYPAVNCAALLFLLGRIHDPMGGPSPEDSRQSPHARLEESRQWAQKLVADLANPQDMWQIASLAEAHLLLGNVEQAQITYWQATHRPDCDAHARSAMRRHANLILKYAPPLLASAWSRVEGNKAFESEDQALELETE